MWCPKAQFWKIPPMFRFCMPHLNGFMGKFLIILYGWDLILPSAFSGERLGRGVVSDAITTPIFNTSAYFFKTTAELIDFKVCIIVTFCSLALKVFCCLHRHLAMLREDAYFKTTVTLSILCLA